MVGLYEQKNVPSLVPGFFAYPLHVVSVLSHGHIIIGQNGDSIVPQSFNSPFLMIASISTIRITIASNTFNIIPHILTAILFSKINCQEQNKMGNVLTQVMNNTSKNTNIVLQSSNQTCTTYNNVNVDNNAIIVENSTIDGDFYGANAGTSLDASCAIVSSMSNIVENILGSIAKQKISETTSFANDFKILGVATQTYNLDQSINNNISQINNALCDTSNMQSVTGNYVYVANSKIGGNFKGVSLDSNASANCAMSNAMKNLTFNSIKSDTDLGSESQGMWTTLLASVCSVIAFGIILLVVVVLIGGVTAVTVAAVGKKKGAEGPTVSKEQQQVDALSNLFSYEELNNIKELNQASYYLR